MNTTDSGTSRQSASRSQYNRSVGKQILEDQATQIHVQSNVKDAQEEAHFCFNLLFKLMEEGAVPVSSSKLTFRKNNNKDVP
jgi:hypothetical protein